MSIALRPMTPPSPEDGDTSPSFAWGGKDYGECSTRRGTAPLSFRALPRPESDGLVRK